MCSHTWNVALFEIQHKITRTEIKKSEMINVKLYASDNWTKMIQYNKVIQHT